LVSVVYLRRILYCHYLCEFKVLMVMIEEYCLLVCKMCSLIDRYQCFGGIYCLYLQGTSAKLHNLIPGDGNLEFFMFFWPCIPYNLVNKFNLVHNLFLVFLSISTCFRWLLCPSSGETTVFIRHLVLWVHTLHTRQPSVQNDKYQVSHKHSCFSWWWAHSHPKHVEIDKYTKNKYTKNKLCTKLALFTG
jgi:hypothetical protein